MLETKCSSWEGEESQAGRVWLWHHRHLTASRERKHIILFSKTKAKAGQGWRGEMQLGKSLGTFSGSFLHISECTEQPSGDVTPWCWCQCSSTQQDRLTAAQTPALRDLVSTSDNGKCC